jgi:hypothetical protein
MVPKAFKRTSLVAAIVLSVSACVAPVTVPERGAYPVDDGGRPITSLELGSTLRVAAKGLRPNQVYDIRLGFVDHPTGSPPLSFARLAADGDGNVQPLHLWYQSGVVGCQSRGQPTGPLPPFLFRSFDEAEQALAGRRLEVTFIPVEPNQPVTTILPDPGASEVDARLQIPVQPRRNPQVYPSDSEGCLLNSRRVSGADMHVSGRNFEPGESVAISVVRNQRKWFVGDTVDDVTGAGGTAAPIIAQADESGRFTAQVWDSALQQRGAYDIVVQRSVDDLRGPSLQINADSIISFASETSYILYILLPPGGADMDGDIRMEIAGRPLSGDPYFQFADSFAEVNDHVWGAVDPTYVPEDHPGGRFAAYYVVEHRNAQEWTRGLIGLVDVSDDGPEIVPVKAGCINGTDLVIWDAPLELGDYDVVVNFGDQPAETQHEFSDDFEYTRFLDFLDGGDRVGFVVAQDPIERGPFGVGSTSYSVDDFFPEFDGADLVDLRAEVRYPAVADGPDQAVASSPAPFPLFLIQHGNHKLCEFRCKDSNGTPIPCNAIQYDPNLPTWPQLLAALIRHDECPVDMRNPNHEGYVELLEILASHGIIAVSMDAYDLTGPITFVDPWIEERARLFLEHLKVWSHLTDTATFVEMPDFFGSRFHGRVDLSRISLSGHSRGGEASVVAYLLNLGQGLGFDIGSVSSIAPTEGSPRVLTDVPYFVILPAADGDVFELDGVRIYDRAGGDATNQTSIAKSSIYVYGANHDFFNSVWAADGDDSSALREDYIQEDQQRALGNAYLAAFARFHLLGESAYEDLFRGRLIFPSTAGRQIHHTHRDTVRSTLQDNNVRISSPMPPNIVQPPTIERVVGPSVHETAAVHLNWKNERTEFDFALLGGQGDTTPYDVLSFRAAITNSSDNIGFAPEFEVRLRSGSTAIPVHSGRFGSTPNHYDNSAVTELLGLDDRSRNNVMTTVRIPLHSFIMNDVVPAIPGGGPSHFLSNIVSVEFVTMSPRGDIWIDDVEFSR